MNLGTKDFIKLSAIKPVTAATSGVAAVTGFILLILIYTLITFNLFKQIIESFNPVHFHSASVY